MPVSATISSLPAMHTGGPSLLVAIIITASHTYSINPLYGSLNCYRRGTFQPQMLFIQQNMMQILFFFFWPRQNLLNGNILKRQIKWCHNYKNVNSPLPPITRSVQVFCPFLLRQTQKVTAVSDTWLNSTEFSFPWPNMHLCPSASNLWNYFSQDTFQMAQDTYCCLWHSFRAQS